MNQKPPQECKAKLLDAFHRRKCGGRCYPGLTAWTGDVCSGVCFSLLPLSLAGLLITNGTRGSLQEGSLADILAVLKSRLPSDVPELEGKLFKPDLGSLGVCVCVSMLACLCHLEGVEARGHFRSWFSPPLMWVLGFELRPSGWAQVPTKPSSVS